MTVFLKKSARVVLKYFFGRRKFSFKIDEPRKILVISRMAIGDMIMAFPALTALRSAFPTAEITILTMEWNRQILQYTNSADKCIFVNNKILMHRDILGLIRLVIRIKNNNYDLAVHFDTYPIPLYSLLAGIKLRIGYQYDDEGFLLTHCVTTDRDIDRSELFLSVIKSIREDVLYQSPVLLENLLPDPCGFLTCDFLNRISGKRLICITFSGGNNPGEKMTARTVTPQKYVEIITSIELRAPERCHYIVLGRGNLEKAQTLELFTLLGSDFRDKLTDQVGNTTLGEVAAILKMSYALISGDCGLMHLSNLVGTKTIALFGPTLWTSRVKNSRHVIPIQSDLSCSPCYDTKGFLNCGNECIDSFNPELVVNELFNIRDY